MAEESRLGGSFNPAVVDEIVAGCRPGDRVKGWCLGADWWRGLR